MSDLTPPEWMSAAPLSWSEDEYGHSGSVVPFPAEKGRDEQSAPAAPVAAPKSVAPAGEPSRAVAPAVASGAWLGQLVQNDRGKPDPNEPINWTLVLENHPETEGMICFNEFSGETILMRRPPWHDDSKEWKPRPITDNDFTEAVLWLRGLGLRPTVASLAAFIYAIAGRNEFHPVRDYFKDLPAWDGVPRLDRWLARYAGVDDTPLTRAFARKFLCAAVRRIKQPGCKFDAVLVLQGDENLGKSMLIKSLCAKAAWFSDQLKIGSDAKTTIEQSSGAWLVEMAEMIGSGRREVDAIKHFVTAEFDKARKAYARTESTVPRQFVLFGTTNENNFLTSLTGNRRFWVVKVTSVDIAAIVADRDQLWAEVLQAEPAEKLFLEGKLYEQNSEANRERTDYGAWGDLLDGAIPDGDVKLPVRTAWGLVGVKPEDIYKVTDQQRRSLQKALAGLGFGIDVKSIRDDDGKKVKAYVRGDQSSAPWFGGVAPATPF
ncbi:hypothetical protein HFO06_05470 [Rhizobium leguminosarum]|uniref:virulence-associated E family protein n=1 Tax=Rhizobium leguminosarum TaxID=384 RepID=UPI001C944F52|nr:virulence-associated E family protein [Rhizobium leguminosarum]MBY5762557.1 hypothetical protein [Rhizobium leguminosarum]